MRYEELFHRHRKLEEQCRKDIERELDEQFVDPGVAAVMTYELEKSVEHLGYWFSRHELTSRSTFFLALEIVLRNRAKLAEAKGKLVPEFPDGPNDEASSR